MAEAKVASKEAPKTESPKVEVNAEAPAQDLERLLQVLRTQSPEALEAVRQVLAGFRLGPVCKAVERALTNLLASGEVSIEDLEQVRVEVVTEGGEKVVRAFPRRRRSRSSAGSDGRLTKDAWIRAGFQAFVVGGLHYAQPLKAIEAAGGEIPMDPQTGRPKPENWWRGIAHTRYSGLGIEAVMAGQRMPLQEAIDLARQHV